MRQALKLEADAAPFVDDYLLYLLAAASSSLSGKFHQHVKQQDANVNEWRVLACLVDRPGLMLTELAGFVLYEQSRLSKIVDRMELQGLVARTKTADDRRKVLIQITPKGRKIVEPLIEAARRHETDSAQCLDGSEIDALKNALKKLIRSNG
ncbi:MAG: MarR family winged helix-turn-helix transcriptional regulator [Rhizobiaceae bacterium]